MRATNAGPSFCLRYNSPLPAGYERLLCGAGHIWGRSHMTSGRPMGTLVIKHNARGGGSRSAVPPRHSSAVMSHRVKNLASALAYSIYDTLCQQFMIRSRCIIFTQPICILSVRPLLLHYWCDRGIVVLLLIFEAGLIVYTFKIVYCVLCMCMSFWLCLCQSVVLF